LAALSPARSRPCTPPNGIALATRDQVRAANRFKVAGAPIAHRAQPRSESEINVQFQRSTFSMNKFIFSVLSGTTILACNEPKNMLDHQDLESDNLTHEVLEASTSSQQNIIFCNYATMTPDAILSTAPPVCGSNISRSPGDFYVGPLCARYVVEYMYKPESISTNWDHVPWSKGECEAMRAKLTTYTFAGAWTTNGTTELHGEWCDPATDGFCPRGRCAATLDSGSPLPAFGSGSKWRVSTEAYAVNCGGSSCYNDHKRVIVEDGSICIPE
jgi:hypothetical protein